MAGMRVHELAKEFGMSSKELLDRLVEMKIPAKNHASTLADPYVVKIRKALGPELEQRARDLELQKEQEEAAARAAEEAARAAEEAARREAMEAEKAAREAEKAAREAEKKAAEEAAAKAAAEELEAKKLKTPQAFSGLLSQIEAEQARLSSEKEQAQKQAEHKAEQKPAAEKSEQHQTSKGKQAPQNTEQDNNQGGGKNKKGKKKPSASQRYAAQFEAEGGLDTEESEGEDRYKQMAVAAERLQRDKALADARAAVAAAQHEGEGRRKKRKEKREAEAKERALNEAIEMGIDPDLVLDDSIVQIKTGATVAEFATALDVSPNEIIKRLFLLGTPLTVTQTISDDLIDLIADDMNRKVHIITPEEEFALTFHDEPSDLLPRPPVVTVMGHVDHGKTSLLDAIRETGVVATEAGGITQHIGASVVWINDRQITFIDTPGHEAFTAMRARGAAVTDVVVLVVAADDGVMPQTIEAIHHAEAANVPIVVAVNKIDKPGADPTRVRQELTEHSIIPEEWGGENMFVEVSAKKRIGIDDLLDTILLQADVQELTANPNARASGFVIEAKLDKGRGPVATVLVQRGTLKVGDVVAAGTAHGRVRALINPKGENVTEAKPSDPVEILGLSSVPAAGDDFCCFEDERDARNLAEDRALRQRLAEQQNRSHVSLEDLFARIEQEGMSELNLIVKADVQGSIEALQDALNKMDQSEVRINVIHSAVGGITETDVTLAAASDAIIIGFNVRPQAKARAAADKERVDIRTYRVIYQAIEDINAARVGLLSPEIVEQDTGIAEVRELFKVPKAGVIAGCFVSEGVINRTDTVRVVRDGTVVFEGKISSMRHYKEDVNSVRSGSDCGIGIEKFQDIHVGDMLESYCIKEVAREA